MKCNTQLWAADLRSGKQDDESLLDSADWLPAGQTVTVNDGNTMHHVTEAKNDYSKHVDGAAAAAQCFFVCTFPPDTHKLQ